jgi:hypothetical protein
MALCEPHGACFDLRFLPSKTRRRNRPGARDAAFHCLANPCGTRAQGPSKEGILSSALSGPMNHEQALGKIPQDATLVATLFELPAIFAWRPACNLAKGDAERARLRVPNRKADVRNRD